MPGHGARGTRERALPELQILEALIYRIGDQEHADQTREDVGYDRNRIRFADPTGEQAIRPQPHFNRWRRRIHTLIREAEAELAGNPYRDERWRCTCGAYGHSQGSYCSRCGKPREEAS